MNNIDTSEENCDKFINLRERISCEERNLDRLIKQYASLRTTVDDKYPADIYQKYRRKAAACIAAFVAVFALSYLLSPYFPFLHLPNYGNATELALGSFLIHANSALIFSDKIIFSIITGISAAVVTIILFVVDNNLKTQQLNEMLASKSFEIGEKRSKILSLLQQDVFVDDRGISGNESPQDESPGGPHEGKGQAGGSPLDLR
jgi:hypothetical protein